MNAKASGHRVVLITATGGEAGEMWESVDVISQDVAAGTSVQKTYAFDRVSLACTCPSSAPRRRSWRG